MHKTFLSATLFILILGCSSEETGELLVDFPQEYSIKEVNTLGTTTYYFTDTVIYKTANDLVQDIDDRGNLFVDSLLFADDTTLNEFFIQSILFNEPGSVTINGSATNGFTELAGIGTIDAFGGLGFKVNPNLEQLISCFTITSRRSIDSLFEGSFLPGLDTLYNADSTLLYQLQIVEGPEIQINYCDPFTEFDLVADFSARNGLTNNERIVTHRTDFIFTKN